MMLLILWGAWLVINLITFILYGVDKRRAKKGAWRIPEKTLLTGTWLLGGVGAWLGMRLFRHKTKHAAFVWGVPPAAVVSLALIILFSVKMSGI